MAAGKTSLATTLGFWTPTKIWKIAAPKHFVAFLSIHQDVPGVPSDPGETSRCTCQRCESGLPVLDSEFLSIYMPLTQNNCNTSTSKIWSPSPCNTYCFQIFAGQRPRTWSSQRILSAWGQEVWWVKEGAVQTMLQTLSPTWWVYFQHSKISKPWHILLYENPPCYGCYGIEHGTAVGSPCTSWCDVVRISMCKLVPEVLCKAPSSVNNSSLHRCIFSATWILSTSCQ